jgi:hypothetical protein
VDHIDLVVSVSPLGKSPSIPTLEHRLAVLEEVAANRSDLGVRTSEHRLIADVAAGYDALVLGADKWLQVTDPSWYDSTAARDAAVASLPRLLLVGRAGAAVVPPAGCALLDVDPGLAEVSSSSARAGRREWMAPEAAAFDELTGAWSDPARYLRWSSAE